MKMMKIMNMARNNFPTEIRLRMNENTLFLSSFIGTRLKSQIFNIIEQVAREQYLMSKPNEDIYLIENKK